MGCLLRTENNPTVLATLGQACSVASTGRLTGEHRVAHSDLVGDDRTLALTPAGAFVETKMWITGGLLEAVS